MHIRLAPAASRRYAVGSYQSYLAPHSVAVSPLGVVGQGDESIRAAPSPSPCNHAPPYHGVGPLPRWKEIHCAEGETFHTPEGETLHTPEGETFHTPKGETFHTPLKRMLCGNVIRAGQIQQSTP